MMKRKTMRMRKIMMRMVVVMMMIIVLVAWASVSPWRISIFGRIT
jgi:hypothetical protein